MELSETLKELLVMHFYWIKVFTPDSLFINIWKVLILFTNIIWIILTPLKFCFDLDLNGNDSESAHIFLFELPVVLYFLDILINFNTGYYEEGVIMLERNKIFQEYIRKNFWLDLLTAMIIPFQAQMEYKLFMFIFLFRIFQVVEIIDDIEENWQIQLRFPAGWVLLKLFISILIVAHYCGCFFYFIGTLS